jgi:hypothetical protein
MKPKIFLCFVVVFLTIVFISIECKQPNEKDATHISEATRKEAIAALENFAKIRTAIPPNPKAYLNLFANDERFVWGSDYGFETDYKAFFDKRSNDPDYGQQLNPNWITRFDFVFRDYKISQIDSKILLCSAYYDELVVAQSGDTLLSKNNVMHGSLLKKEGEWKILTMIFAHPGENEKMDADFDARNSK